MKIRIREDDHFIELEVPEEDFTVMIEEDYKRRCSVSEDKTLVERRTPQEIVDELFNRPEYNNWHKHHRHLGKPKTPFRKDDETDDTEIMDTIPSPENLEETVIRRIEDSEFIEKLYKVLKKNHADVLIAVHIIGKSVKDYAKREGVSESAISQRLKAAEKNFKKIFLKP